MKKLNLFQHTYKSIYSVYNITNFLDDKYLELLLDKTISLTEKDSMNRSSNVQANMTKYNELLKHEEYKKFKPISFHKILKGNGYLMDVKSIYPVGFFSGKPFKHWRL